MIRASLSLSLVKLNAHAPILRRFSSSSHPRVLETGDVFRRRRVFTAEDVIDYCQVSHDSNPLHLDAELAKNAGFEGSIVHGLLVASLFPLIISSHFPGAIYVSQGLQFKLPVYVGDEILGEVVAVNIRQVKKKYLAKFTTKCFKSNGLTVVDGEALAILPCLAVEMQQSLDNKA